ncbi:Oidioi.mRNA.OKI2018_I69.chr2.g8286.t1.cds [Oikopleura dioica]|uniref:Oidioi.mRNA.OKI2018_I69.chr2.g8286.t1.cds n=1 Tax=Oikopleura dioica TaxID=34765 RepID=A0ABN7TD92_OIKDI|nr:Oidioi.mRNA.OKI2018_I69.chr2.g8286.t1.cds [Oikopleura dioica]
MADIVTESVSGYLRFQLIQVGLENGLFDVIEVTLGKTTKQIANEANCDTRYVEEWCQALALGNILVANLDNNSKEYLYSMTADMKKTISEMTPMLRLVNSVGSAIPEVCSNFSSGAPVFFEKYCNVAKNISNALGPWTKFHCQDASEFTTTGQQFELICFFVCLHDFAHPTKALQLCQHLLTSDGKVIVIEMAGKDHFAPEK